MRQRWVGLLAVVGAITLVAGSPSVIGATTPGPPSGGSGGGGDTTQPVITPSGDATRGNGCPAYDVIDSRGSGEPEGTVSPPGEWFYAQFLSLHSGYTVQQETNPYPAAGDVWTLIGGLLKLPAAYNTSVVAGETWLANRLNTLVSTCPATKILLSGYSQGAQVTGDVYERASSSLRLHILGVALFGDPYFNSRDTAWADATSGSAPPEGIFTVGVDGALAEVLNAPRPFYPPDTKFHVLSFCHGGDPVCQGDPLRTFIINLALHQFTHHDDYAGWYEPQFAANYFTSHEGTRLTNFAVCPSSDVAIIGHDPYTGVSVYRCNHDWSGVPAFTTSQVFCTWELIDATGSSFSEVMRQGATQILHGPTEQVGGSPWFVSLFRSGSFARGSYSCDAVLNGAVIATKTFTVRSP
jgi:Cutinase